MPRMSSTPLGLPSSSTVIRAFATAWLLIALACGLEPAAAAPQWQSLPGAPVSVRMDDLCFISPDTGWVCTGEGRIYHTTDAGASWELQHDDPNLYFRCIRFADSQRGWAGTLNTEALMFQTVNGGEDWTPITNLPEPRPSAICGMSVPASHLIYAVGSYFGPARVLKSSDGGTTWAAMDLAPLASTLIDVQFRSPLEGFAVGSIGTFPYENRAVVMHTGDGGANWDRRFLGDRDGEWGWKISFPTPSVGYVSLERENPPMFFLKTTDAGSNWTELPFVDHNEQGIGFVTPEIGWIGGAGNPTFGTTDGGANWTLTPWGYYLNRFQFLSTSLGYGSGITVYKYSDDRVSVPRCGPAQAPVIRGPEPVREPHDHSIRSGEGDLGTALRRRPVRARGADAREWNAWRGSARRHVGRDLRSRRAGAGRDLSVRAPRGGAARDGETGSSAVRGRSRVLATPRAPRAGVS